MPTSGVLLRKLELIADGFKMFDSKAPMRKLLHELAVHFPPGILFSFLNSLKILFTGGRHFSILRVSDISLRFLVIAIR